MHDRRKQIAGNAVPITPGTVKARLSATVAGNLGSVIRSAGGRGMPPDPGHKRLASKSSAGARRKKRPGTPQGGPTSQGHQVPGGALIAAPLMPGVKLKKIRLPLWSFSDSRGKGRSYALSKRAQRDVALERCAENGSIRLEHAYPRTDRRRPAPSGRRRTTAAIQASVNIDGSQSYAIEFAKSCY